MARLTPRDIQEKEFTSGFRGYKEQDVDEFLDRVTASYEEAFKENLDLKEEVERLHEENKKYELIGERMQAALVAAQETADDVRKNATKEAENILREAEIKAHKLVQASRDQHRELQKSLAVVKQVEEEFRFKLKSTLQSYLKLLDEVALGDGKEIKKWILPEDMSVLDERRREMEGRESKTEAREASAEVASSKEEAPRNDVKAPEAAKVEEPKVEEIKVAEKKAEAPKIEDKKDEEDAEAKAKALLADIVQQAADEAEAADTTMAGDKKKAEKMEEPKVEAKAETPKAENASETPKVEAPKAEKTEEPKVEKTADAPKEDASFDKEGAKGSAVTAEWATLQAAVAEAVKEADKPKAETPKAEAKKVEAEIASAPKTEAPRNDGTTRPEEPKAEAKEAKPGKVNLDDIEIVEDESFWKDI